MKVRLKKPFTFEWDEGNKEKNVKKHNVQNSETEEVFFNNPILLEDNGHSEGEERFFAFGFTDKGRRLMISFTLRGEKQERIRPIMSRDQNKREKEFYQKQKSEVIKTK